MNRRLYAVEFIAYSAAIGIVVLSLSVLMNGCGSALLRSEGPEALYTSALVRCVDKATTLAESKACRADVDKQFGVTHDGGDQ